MDNKRQLLHLKDRASIIKMTIGAFGVYVVAIVRTQTLKIVLSRVCIFATQDWRPLVLWLGNGVCASAFWGLWSHAPSFLGVRRGKTCIFYRKTNSQIASPLEDRLHSQNRWRKPSLQLLKKH